MPDWNETDLQGVEAQGRLDLPELPDDKAHELLALFDAQDNDAICEKLDDTGNAMDSANRSAETQRTRTVLLGEIVGRGLWEQMNEQCLAALNWLIIAGGRS